MKTITLTDEQFDTLFEYLDNKVESIVEKSIDYQDSEILEEWEDLFDVHTELEAIKKVSKSELQTVFASSSSKSNTMSVTL